jgi:peptidoglycan/xylan/chitin deacetylase (PgdA/CDA1 family)
VTFASGARVGPPWVSPRYAARARRGSLLSFQSVAVRERLARLLLRTGALDATLRVRARVRAPLVTILTYHHVFDPASDYAFDAAVADATPAQFRRHLEVIARRFTVIGVDELCKALDGAPLPPNPAMITFDDGYRSCLEVAVPILRDVGLRAVFFIATSFVEERRLYWWERIAYLVGTARAERVTLTYPEPREIDLHAPGAAGVLVRVIKNTPGLDVDRFLDHVTRAAKVDWDAAFERRLADNLIMSWDQIRALRDAGMDVESHTRRHRVLQTLDAAALADELTGSRLDLERQLGQPVRAVAYPVGRPISHLKPIRDAVAAAGYQVGFTNASGSTLLIGDVDRFDVRRIAVDRDISEAMFLGQMAIPPLGYQAKIPRTTYAGH